MGMSILAKKTKTPRMTQKCNNLLKTQRILNIIMSAKGTLFLVSDCQGGRPALLHTT